MTKIAKRYAQALIDAVGLNNADDILHFVGSLSNAIENNPNLKIALLNPAVPTVQRKSVLLAILEVIQKNKVQKNKVQKDNVQENNIVDSKISSAEIFSTMSNFIDLLMSKSRLSIISDIFADLDSLIKQYKKALSITFISARPMSASQMQSLETKLLTDYGSLATVKWEVSPELIGGAKILIDDAIIDNSIKAKLDSMKENLLRQI